MVGGEKGENETQGTGGLKEVGKSESTDEDFRITSLWNPNPGNLGPESGSFIGVLGPKIFLAIIRYCVIIDAYCST